MTSEARPLVKSFFEPESFTWSHVVVDEATGHAAIVDPVWVYDPVTGQVDESFTGTLLDTVNSAGWNLDWVLETHAHADHLSSGALVRARTGAPLVIGAGIRGVQKNFAKVYHLEDFPADGRQFDRLVRDGDTLALGKLTISVMETPGHTGDSVTYLVGDAAFVGDTLFAPRYGTARCDFPGGDAERLYDSIQALHALPDDTRLFLCHDYPPGDEAPIAVMSVAESRRDNIHVGTAAGSAPDKGDFVAMRRSRDAKLGLPRLILPSLQVNIRGGAAPEPEGNGAAYLKIPFDTTIPELLGGD